MTNSHFTDSFLPDSTSGIAAGLRVKLVAGKRTIVPADAADQEIAVTVVAATHNRYPVECRLVNGGGSMEVLALGAVTQGAMLKRDAGGKVSVAGGGSNFGICDEAGTDSLVAVFPL